VTALEKVRSACERVVADISSGGHPLRALEIEPAPADYQHGVLVRYGGHHFSVDERWDLETIVAYVADRLQDDVVDDTGAGWPTGAVGAGQYAAGLHDGVAVWLHGDVVVSTIGHL